MSGSDPVVVYQVNGTVEWGALCLDDRCGCLPHELAAEGATQAVARRAATIHRKYLAALAPDPAKPLRATHCEACGQSKAAIEQLQELVRTLEQRLADIQRGAL